MIAEDLSRGRLVVASDCWLRLAEPYAVAWNPASLDRPMGREFRTFILQSGQRLEKSRTRDA